MQVRALAWDAGVALWRLAPGYPITLECRTFRCIDWRFCLLPLDWHVIDSLQAEPLLNLCPRP